MQKTSAIADRHFLILLAVLLVFGLVVLASASAPLGFAKFNDTFFFLKRQVLFGLLPGIVLFLILARFDYRRLVSWGPMIYLGALGLLAFVFFPGIGLVINGSRSWLGLLGYNFQPSELAKLAVIIMGAYLITTRKRDWNDWQTSLVPVLATLSPAALLVMLQPDVGTLSILVMIIFVILYIAKIPSRFLLIMGLAGVIVFGTLVIAAPYRLRRLTTFLHPELDPQGVGYQINQAFLAVGSGGIWGLGFGQSRQKYQYLPEVNADSIFAVVGEELGFIVSAGIIILILMLGWRGFKIAAAAPDDAGKLLVCGIMAWFLWQSFLNIGAIVGALPLTGVPLPFVSHGGSALLMMLGAMGVVANVSKFARLN